MDEKIEKVSKETPKFTEPKVRKDKIWKIIALMTVCAIVFGAVGYYAGQGKDENTNIAEATKTADLSSIIQTATNTATASATKTTDITSNWKTYSNDKYGISFKYPDSVGSPTATEYAKGDVPTPVDKTSVKFDYEKGKEIYLDLTKVSDYADSTASENYNKLASVYDSKSATGAEKLWVPPSNAGIMAASTPKYIESADGKFRGVYYYANVGQDYGVAIEAKAVLTDKTNVVQFAFHGVTNQEMKYNCFFGAQQCSQDKLTEQFEEFKTYVNGLDDSSSETVIKEFTLTFRAMVQSVK